MHVAVDVVVSGIVYLNVLVVRVDCLFECVLICAYDC